MTQEKATPLVAQIDRLVFADLDETILDTTYTVTHPSIYQSIQEAQLRGWTVGLSSDRGFEGVAQWAERLGVGGPIIAERGAIIGCNGLTIEDEVDCHEFLGSKQKIIEHLRDAEIPIEEGDPYHVLRTEPPASAKETGRLVVINGIRRHSVGFHVRVVDREGNMKIEDSLTAALVDDVRPLLPSFPDLIEDLNHNYGVFIASRETTTKRKGTLRLLQALGLGRCAMVGDTMNDFLGKDVAQHYAVQNATPEFKEVADYVSAKPRSAGVSEIFASILDSS